MLWMSHFGQTNDYQEVSYPIDLLAKLEQEITGNNNEDELNIYYSEVNRDRFLLSMVATEKESEYHWEKYSKNFTGVRIGLSKKVLWDLSKNFSSIGLGKVIYNESIQTQIIKKICSLEKRVRDSKSLETFEFLGMINNIFHVKRYIISFMKHVKWEREEEARLFVVPAITFEPRCHSNKWKSTDNIEEEGDKKRYELKNTNKAVTSILLGKKLCEADEVMIRNIIRSNNIQVTVERSKL